MDDHLLLQVDEMTRAREVDESRLFDLIALIGSDISGLRLLVDRYDQASDWRVLGCIAVLLSRTAWDSRLAPDARSMILDFIETTRALPQAGTLISALNSLPWAERE